ncbi:hypothetical protein J2Y74_003558 [Pseudomonas migulae]|nr:hypothetical protein [Pseudomonas migulae]
MSETTLEVLLAQRQQGLSTEARGRHKQLPHLRLASVSIQCQKLITGE